MYGQLGTRDLDVHAYAAPSESGHGVEVDGVTVHLSPTEEIARSWFVVYDGGGERSNTCALLAEERDDRRFSGFWTVDPELVAEIDDHLDARY